MTRKIALSLLSVAFITLNSWAGGPEIAQEPDFFSGFFVGPTGAFHMAGFNGSSTLSAPQPVVVSGTFPGIPPVTVTTTLFPAGAITTNNISGNAFDGYYGVHGGVGKVFNHRWYMGIVGFGEWGNQSFTANNSDHYFSQTAISSLPASTTLTFAADANNTTTLRISNDYGVALRPGFLVAPRSMVYGKVGAIWANLKISNLNSGVTSGSIIVTPSGAASSELSYQGQFNGNSNQSERKVAWLLGIGFEQFIYQDFVAFNVEYNYASFGSVSTSTPILVNGTVSDGTPITQDSLIVNNASANAKVSSLLAGLNIYFGSHWF